MILKALYDYYNRCDDIAPDNMAYVKYLFAIVINEKGDFIKLEPLGDENGLSLLTFRPEERTSSPVAHCMGDNGSYVLGLVNTSIGFKKELDNNAKNHNSFKTDIDKIHTALPNNITAEAVFQFYKKYDNNTFELMKKDSYWNDFCKTLKDKKNITFKIGNTYSVCDAEILKYKALSITNTNSESICLITGHKGLPVSTTYSTFILGGKSNAKLVSFQEKSGYDSYGKTKGLNAPISQEAEFKYTTALLHLLRKNSRNKFMIGNRTFIFWGSSRSEAATDMENAIYGFFGANASNDNPDANTANVRDVFESIYSGIIKTDLDESFFIAGLAPNAARIALVYWSEIKLKDFAGIIKRHFDDMEITRKEKRPYIGLGNIVSAVTLNGKQSEAIPHLPESIVKSIFQGTKYPETLYMACLRRIRAEQEITITRAAIIKAYLNRNFNSNITIMLNKENKNPGYLCGRLFAVLEDIQEKASNANASTIRKRYINAASSTPAIVFPTLLNLSTHHIEKLNEGKRIFYEKIEQEIIDKLPDEGFLPHLDLQDQGRFFIGYYQQKQVLKGKHEEATEDENVENE